MLELGVHLLVIDLFSPTPRDPNGIHDAIWQGMGNEPFTLPQDKRLTLVSYSAGTPIEAFIEPVAVGDALPPMPLFLTPDEHILIPLETTYLAAWDGVPERWRDELVRA